jgi:hypothetical protein
MLRRGGRRSGDADLVSHATTVAGILQAIGVDPQAATKPVQQGYGWHFKRGSALIEVYVSVHDGVGYLQVLSPLMVLPQSQLLPLYRRLLEMNLQMTAVALGVHQDTVYAFHERPLEGMDAAEANSVINTVAGYADELDDRLVQEFGGRLYGRV